MNFDELFEFEIIEDSYRIKSYLRKDDPTFTDIEIPAEHKGGKIRLIMPGAFENARYIRTVRLPESVIALAPRAFAGCTSLESVRFASKKIAMLSGIFLGCTSLKSIVLPETHSISGECFMGCSALEEVTVLGRIWEVSYNAFRDCVSLKKVTLPKSLEVIGGNAFANCPSLESITPIGPDIEVRNGGGLFGCPKLPPETLLPLARERRLIKAEKVTINWNLILSRADVFALALKELEERPSPELVIGKGDISLLPAAAENGMFTAENIDGLAERSVKNGSTEVTAWLLEYKNRTFGFNGGDKYEL